jgi:NAD(P)-dependent dehydrogenase (short-subunit alcohol dehydrogenase family)
MNGIDGRVAIVAGGATTFGEGIVRAFVDAGASVTVADIDEAGERVAADLGDSVLFARTDVTVDEDIERAVDATEARFGGVDFLVTMTATYVDDGMSTSRDDWLRALNVNLVGVARFVQAVVPTMQRRGGGAIVNFGSIGGKVGRVGRWVYPTSKAAVIQLTRCQAADLAPLGIRVNSVSPAWTRRPAPPPRSTCSGASQSPVRSGRPSSSSAPTTRAS